MTERQQRIHWVLSHLSDALVIVLIVFAILYFGGVM